MLINDQFQVASHGWSCLCLICPQSIVRSTGLRVSRLHQSVFEFIVVMVLGMGSDSWLTEHVDTLWTELKTVNCMPVTELPFTQ